MNVENLVIDATTVKSGGGIHHLALLLEYLDTNNSNYNLSECIVSREFFHYLEKSSLSIDIINKIHIVEVDSLVYPLFQFFYISKRVKVFNEPTFLILTSTNFIKSKKTILMPQNLLPFDYKNILKYGISKEFLRLIILRYLGKISILRSRRIIFLSSFARNKIISSFSNNRRRNLIYKKSKVNHLPITKRDIKYNFKQNKNSNDILYVSRIDHYKHQDYVIKEIEYLINKYQKKFNLIIAGPTYKPYYEKHSNLFNKDFVTFKGELNNTSIKDLYENSQVAIFASDCESCPIIILEMMKYSIPFVIPDLPLYKEFVPEIYPRFRLEVSGSLSTALSQLLNNNNLAKEIIEAGKEKIKDFDPYKLSHSLFAI
tara:strand:- start:17017 stop:18132 length:1116 start_codon:yes stop_codon:yes gene_type:complete